jgi:hypothetical protein
MGKRNAELINRKWIFTVLITLALPAALGAATYYVSPSGNDANSGSSAAPWKTLQFGASNLVPGDTLNAKAGTYAGFVVGWDPAGQGVYGVIAGTAGHPITIQADPAAAAGSVIINSGNSKTHVGVDLEPGCDFITISGFTIDGAGGIANYPDKGSGIKATGNDDVIRNNIVRNIDYGFGITSDEANRIVIDGNTVTGTGSHGNTNYGHAIYVAGATDGAIVTGNILHDNDYTGLQFNGDPDLVTGALVEGNRIYDNGGNAINADGLQTSIIRNNVFYDFEHYGIVLFQTDASAPSINNTIVNNTIVVGTYKGVAGLAPVRINSASTGNVIFNNVLIGGGGISARISDDSLPGLKSDANVVGALFQSDDDGSTQSLAAWRTQTGQDIHSFAATPAQLFVNSGAGDFRLSSTSPAIDKGLASLAGRAAASSDVTGGARPTGSAVDIGAYEFGSVPGGGGSNGGTNPPSDGTGRDHILVNPAKGLTAVINGASSATIYDRTGGQVRNLQGNIWDGRDNSGAFVPAGVYMARTDSGRRVRIVVIR